LFLLFVFLFTTSGYNFWQVQQLQTQISALKSDNTHLRVELARHKGVHAIAEASALDNAPIDPATDAETHLTNAESELTHGNVGDAISDCKIATTDIQAASNSTSSSVRGSVASLQAKLNDIQQQASNLVHKLGV
jgi:hypothetical protein